MRIAFLSALLALCACNPQTTTPPSLETTPQQSVSSAAVRNAGKVEGWETSQENYARLGTTAPNFSVSSPTGALPDGYTTVTQDTLRGRWTILAFPAEQEDSLELRYLNALLDAADQDPDLDFFLMGGPQIVGEFSIGRTPAYLLIGPDLTIEAYRGALSATPEDGIKPVIRGVAEIKKQIAAPQ